MRFGDIDSTSNTNYVASLELCKELYGLSGWDDDELEHFFREDMPDITKDADGWAEWMAIPASERIIAPAYSLGYLLRKLPPYTRIETMKGDVPYRVCYDNGVSERGVNADTPEDAACALTIQLIKAKVLTP